MALAYSEVEQAFNGSGLAVRGGFVVAANEEPITTRDGRSVRTVVLVGHAGGTVWPAFERDRRDEPDPLDAWTKRLVDPIARQLGAEAAYPSDRPYRPFQRWAQRAEPVHPSPLGILIHPDYGLWHAYRAALLFTEVMTLPTRPDRPSPCATCVEKPCLVGCPVTAFSRQGFDDAACSRHLRSGNEPCCLDLGCRARDACPVGREWRYSSAQIAFHMAAFFLARSNQGVK